MIPQDAALVEIIRYVPFSHQAGAGARWGSPRYGAYVLQAVGPPQWADLGEAALIDAAVADLRSAIAIQASIDQLRPLARTLDAALMSPIRPLLGEANSLLLSPDGTLSLLPWEVLVDEQQQYQLDRYSVSYLTSGRDLLRLSTTSQHRQAPLVLANPDYDNASRLIDSSPVAVSNNQHLRSGDLAFLNYSPLPGTQAESEAIQNLLPDATVLLGMAATETRLKQVQGPYILHVASHGFFLPDQELALHQPFSGNFFSPPQYQTFKIENPLLRSGLALSGFNRRRSGRDDGVLTALEVAGLDLGGTQLVVLSACETGLGDIHNGEGVYGLRRALVIAGSQSQVISLWKVSDSATKAMMVDYYQRLLTGAGRQEALRQAKITLLRNTDYQHPYYWASFILSGDWSPLEKASLAGGISDHDHL
ncbi:tr [Leptolyngbya sp. Heron Island J]|nr:tr [Leptolyngbya sp. Heron Island J]